MIRRVLLCALCLPLAATAQIFTDVTPGGIPAVEMGDMAWADYNNDGYLDFAIMGVSASGMVGAIYTGAGNGTFQLLANNNMPKMRTGDLDWGDFDNDGDLDLAMIGETDATPWEITVIMRNNGTSFEKYFTTNGSEGVHSCGSTTTTMEIWIFTRLEHSSITGIPIPFSSIPMDSSQRRMCFM